MKKDKKLKFSGSLPAQTVDPKVEEVAMTEEEEKKKKGIVAWFKKYKKGVTATGIAVGLVLILTLTQCSTFQNKDNETDDLPTPPGYEDMDDESNKTDDNDEKDIDEEDDELTGIIDEEDDVKEGETGVQVPTEEPTENEGKETIPATPLVPATPVGGGDTTTTVPPVVDEPEEEHTHAFGEWVKLDENKEQRTCSCGETEERSHTMVAEDPTYVYKYGDKHTKTVVSECSTCDYETKTDTVENCHYTFTSFNATYEYFTCDECGHKITKKHVLDKGTVQKDGSTVYLCIHEDCDYKKVVERTNNDDNEHTNGGNHNTGGDNNPGGGDNNPGGGDNNPGGGDNNPGGGDNNPGGGDNNPGGGDNNPGGGDNNPGEGDTKPGEGDTKPGEGDGDGSGDEDKRDEYEDGSEKEPDRGESDKDDQIEVDDDENENENSIAAGGDSKQPESGSAENQPEQSAPSESQPEQSAPAQTETEAGKTEEAASERVTESVGTGMEADRNSQDQATEIEVDIEETAIVSSVQAELQTLYAMREIVVSGVSFEYPVPVVEPVQATQYVLKK